MPPHVLNARALAKHPLPALDHDVDKEDRGQVLVVGGSAQVPGAVLLTGIAALRAGAGKLKLAVPRSFSTAVGLAIPESGIIALPETSNGEPRFAASLTETFTGAAAVVVGPGLMSAPAATALIRVVLKLPRNGALILDAFALEGLSATARRQSVRIGSRKETRRSLVITPHHGEMAALMGVTRAEIARRPLDFARDAAAKHKAIVVLKSETTHVVTPTGEAWVYEGGVPGLATSGSGDILAGLVAGLVARCSDPLTACLWAVAIHARAGKALSSRIAPLGFLARELLDEIPRLLRKSA